MSYNAQNAPFGAVTTYRITSALYRVVDTVFYWNARRTMEAEFSALSPRELEDIGLVAAAKEAKDPGVFAQAIIWVQDKIDAAKTARELASLSPKLMDDVGLSQADIAYYRDRASFL